MRMCTFYWLDFSGESWLIKLPIIPNSDIHALVELSSLKHGLGRVTGPRDLLFLTSRIRQKQFHFLSPSSQSVKICGNSFLHLSDFYIIQ